MAVQLLYQQNFLKTAENFDGLKNDLVENYLFCDSQEPTSFADKIDEDFLNNLLAASKADEKKIDSEIIKFLQDEENFLRLDEIMQNVLRLAALELKYIQDTPTKVVIDEYVDIAAAFFPAKKITFVNALIDNLAKNLRSEK